MIIVYIVGAILVLFIAFVALQSSSFRLQRSASINAPANVVFPQVNDFHNWQAWSPWEKIDPNLLRTYDGPASGVGSIYSWSGNKQVGEGRMTILESDPNSLIRIKLEFFKPFKATNTAEFTFWPDADQTVVTWSMSGNKNFIMKFIHLLMNMDKMIGSQFEKGLADMKTICEASTKR